MSQYSTLKIGLKSVLLASLFLSAACNGNDKDASSRTVHQSQQTTQMENTSKRVENSQKDSKRKVMSNNGNNPVVTMETSKGVITLELNAGKAPNTVANMVSYIEEGFYDGLVFHRVIPNFMIQGGGMTTEMKEKPNKPPVKNEANNGLKNNRGTIAMARTNDPHSATSQFFINLKDNGFLDFSSETPAGWGYTVFGKVTDGMDVVDEIASVKTGNHGYHGDVPLESVIINKMTLQE